jgi:hypothetical protein
MRLRFRVARYLAKSYEEVGMLPMAHYIGWCAMMQAEKKRG